MLLALPLTADAQQQRSDDRRTDHARSESRKTEPRQADQRPSDQHQSPLPWWERQQAPAWETKQTPAWELNRIPGWETGNVARAMLDQQRFQSQQRDQGPNVNQRRGRQHAPSVIYVLPAYRYFPESIPTTTQFVVTPPPPTEPVTVAPESPPPPPTPPPPSITPERVPPVSVGSKTLYVIPGCYLGNVSPKNVVLPAGCDISKLKTITP
jgi:hypothetical protein